MSEIKKKYVKIFWNEISIEKIEIVENGQHNFIIDTFNYDILTLMNSLNKDFKFKFNGDNFSMYIKDSIDPINIRHDKKVFFGSKHISVVIPDDPTIKRNNLNIAKEVLKLFEIKYKQKKVRKKIKSQLNFLGYNPGKIKTVSNNYTDEYYVTVDTNIGRIVISVKNDNVSLDNIVYINTMFKSIGEIDNKIEILEERIKNLNKMKELYLDLSFEICNFVI